MSNTPTSLDRHEHTSRCRWNSDHARWTCPADPAAPAGAATTGDPDRALVDVRDMIVVHTALLREFRLVVPAVLAVRPADVRRARVVDHHIGFVCDLLHHHHVGEDELLWPKLRERVHGNAATLLDQVEAQHAQLDAALQRVNGARRSWTAGPNHSNRDLLAAVLQSLSVLLSDHLDLEERAILPLAASVLTEAEWHAIGEAGVAVMSKPSLLLAFGMFAYEGDPAVLRDMLRSAPALPRLLLPRVAPRVYARRAARTYGTRQP